jgi:hypothetical protein
MAFAITIIGVDVIGPGADVRREPSLRAVIEWVIAVTKACASLGSAALTAFASRIPRDGRRRDERQ